MGGSGARCTQCLPSHPLLQPAAPGCQVRGRGAGCRVGALGPSYEPRARPGLPQVASALKQLPHTRRTSLHPARCAPCRAAAARAPLVLAAPHPSAPRRPSFGTMESQKLAVHSGLVTRAERPGRLGEELLAPAAARPAAMPQGGQRRRAWDVFGRTFDGSLPPSTVPTI